MKRLLVILSVAAIFVACGGGDDKQAAPSTTAGEACETDSATLCGINVEGLEAVLMCIATANGSVWSESDVCFKSEYCSEDSKCVVDCNSAWLCEGKECGDDGCGGSCGGCPVGANCVSGACLEYVCEPQCAGLACGPDGCGGSCGDCAGDTICLWPDFACFPKPEGCVPNCADKACGPNGCGGQCGSCVEGTFCQAATLTCESPCVPSCEGKVCGDDGCGGSCGGCAGDNEFCISGQCGPCDPVLNVGCPDDSYCTYIDGKGPQCDVAGTQKYGEPCGGLDSCGEGVCIKLSSSELEAICYRICGINSDCGEGNLCMTLTDSAYMVCGAGGGQLQKCNLLEQDCDLDVDGCYFDGAANDALCMTAGGGQEGESCSGQPNDCAEGFLCVSSSGANNYTCRKFCNTTKGKEPMCDTDGTFPSCTNYWNKQTAGYCTEE
jgi:hypothetical protein